MLYSNKFTAAMNLFLRSSSLVSNASTKTISLIYPHKKKSHGERSSDLGDHKYSVKSWGAVLSTTLR